MRKVVLTIYVRKRFAFSTVFVRGFTKSAPFTRSEGQHLSGAPSSLTSKNVHFLHVVSMSYSWTDSHVVKSPHWWTVACGPVNFVQKKAEVLQSNLFAENTFLLKTLVSLSSKFWKYLRSLINNSTLLFPSRSLCQEWKSNAQEKLFVVLTERVIEKIIASILPSNKLTRTILRYVSCIQSVLFVSCVCSLFF